jgi:putative membrane protein
VTQKQWVAFHGYELFAEAGSMTKKLKVEKTRERSLAKGLLAGLIGGVVAAAAKSLTERVYLARTHVEPEPPSLPAERIGGHELATTQKAAPVEPIHWGFGALAGAA